MADNPLPPPPGQQVTFQSGQRPEGRRSRTLLRFITCGSVDDGKSTLIGRLLAETGSVSEDQLAAIDRNGKVDYARLVDGLAAEREQGITIDVAYRFFSTGRRKFIIADCPGHEQYTRNMVTGASTADLAIVLVDACKGVLTQTRRHSYLCHLLGIRSFVLAVNKMDLAGYEQATFDRIEDDFRQFAGSIGIDDVTAIPVSGLQGDNVTAASAAMPWFTGNPLLRHLDTVVAGPERGDAQAFRMPVQWVNRPDQSFRGFAGLIATGSVRPGDAIRIAPTGVSSTVERIVTKDGDLGSAAAGQSVTLTLTDEVDCSRGNVIAAAADPPQASDAFQATIVWMDEEPLHVGRAYILKMATQSVPARVQEPKYEINVNTLDRLAAKTLTLNAIGVAEVLTDRPIVFESYAQDRTLGGFILIDRLSNRTVAAGLIHFALRRAQNVHWQPLAIRREQRAALKNQVPRVLWFTGLSGSGKSTIANEVEQMLHLMNRHTFLLDGDNVRHGLNRDLGFTQADRIENIRRIGEVAALMADAGLIVLAAFISPFRAEREMVRRMLPEGEFVEIYVDTPLHVAEARDVKGLYKKARAGEIANFTGVDSPYEPPEHPDIVVNTTAMTARQAARYIVDQLLPLK
ncbi:adenylyl-sulfate kinase [Porphyrobacter sp. GA68]|uniref:adenylyl-sulfate kinase n=1 Tax=Porphyrobacter sp. GA68 TaxID=2883480 RepID=UPI001D194679|nr:adenylyl-sulfate kinase [Porphyrobacter sp. GA68]